MLKHAILTPRSDGLLDLYAEVVWKTNSSPLEYNKFSKLLFDKIGYKYRHIINVLHPIIKQASVLKQQNMT